MKRSFSALHPDLPVPSLLSSEADCFSSLPFPAGIGRLFLRMADGPGLRQICWNGFVGPVFAALRRGKPVGSVFAALRRGKPVGQMRFRPLYAGPGGEHKWICP